MNSNSSSKRRFQFKKIAKSAIKDVFMEYETPKLVVINNPKYATLLRIIQIIILIYSVLYLLIYEKGYQKEDTAPISAVTLKVKGIGYAYTPDNQTIIIDGADYIIPPSENNAIFIMTNFIRTDQIRTKCAEATKIKGAVCKSDSDCSNKPFTPTMNGRWTGRCLLSPETNVLNRIKNNTKTPTGLCEYAGWCPPEDDQTSTMIVQEVRNFTIFMKNFIEFPTFEVKHKNMVDELTKPCIFHPKTNKDCPIFTIDHIINEAEKNLSEHSLMLHYGCVIRMKVDWDCNLDRKIKLCKPEYSFARLDIPFYENPFSPGFNFRYATSWKQNQTYVRALTKAYGLRLIIAITGKAGKFDFITLTLNIGSLVGIFGLATFICDIAILHLSKKAHTYRKHIFDTVQLSARPDTILELAKRHMRRASRFPVPPSTIAEESSAETPDDMLTSPEQAVTMDPDNAMNSDQ
ncbi:unnamed protein product [Rotaria sordida]|uniref:Purinergic receptor n=2 Tax=Rotaria sordida TaxID=392033 RepID=A0A813Y625_9BILA|nr:unnamed protein product [Rotaria sordida]